MAVPFLALIGAILQTGFMLWAQQNLDYSLQKAVRTILTGQFQIAHAGQTNTAILLAALKSNMCGSASSVTIYACSGVLIDVTLGTSFASSTAPTPLNPTTKDWAANFGTHYSCAAPGAIVIATAAVKFPLFFGLLNTGLSDFADGSTLLQTTSVFRTEPYSTTGASVC